MRFKKLVPVLYLIALISICARCNKSGNNGQTPAPEPPAVNEVDIWLTKANGTVLLQKQNKITAFGTTANSFPDITVNDLTKYQTIDGFGYTLTGGSATLINQMSEVKKNELITELFGNGENGIGLSYIRLSMGASDLDASVFSYNDLLTGQTDIDQTKFTINADKTHLIPVLKKILAINPAIKIIATPWSPPTWMKDRDNSIGGSLKPEYYASYATYFVKYIQAMKGEGITIHAITPQNEPLHPGNNPSMSMTSEQQRDFIKNNLGPAFENAAVTTKIIVFDHNLNRIDYPTTIYNDPAAAKYVDGAAFHLYEGEISAMGTLHNNFPAKNLYFTEQWTDSRGQFAGDLQWHIKNVIIGSTRNWSKIALAWNLANDPNMEPHTPGGCDRCLGAITISGSNFSRNVAYYNIAHASKFVPDGSVRIESNNIGNVQNVTFLRPDGKKAMIALNDTNNAYTFNLKYKGKWATITLDANSVATLVW
jgi:glucosylceramidase